MRIHVVEVESTVLADAPLLGVLHADELDAYVRGQARQHGAHALVENLARAHQPAGGGARIGLDLRDDGGSHALGHGAQLGLRAPWLVGREAVERAGEAERLPSFEVVVGAVVDSLLDRLDEFEGFGQGRRDLGGDDLAEVRGQVSNDIVGGQRRGFRARERREKVSASGFARVRAHQRHMRMPARAPFQRGIDDNAPLYKRDLSAAVVRVYDRK